MCDLYGDIESQGLLIDCNVLVNESGHVIPDDQDCFGSEIKGVYECVSCSVKDVLPLIGHSYAAMSKLLRNDQFLPFNTDVIKDLNEETRKPSCFLVKENDQLYGVVIADEDQASVVGIVKQVLPAGQDDQRKNVVMLNTDGQLMLTNTADIDMDEIISETNAKLGVVSLDGYLLVKQNDSEDLTLILQQGYFILEDGDVTWMRWNPTPVPVDTEQTEWVKLTKLRSKEIFVTNSGLIMNEPGSKSMILISAHNAIVNYSAFRQCIACLDSYQQKPATDH